MKVVFPRQAKADKLGRHRSQFGERIGQRSHGSKRLFFQVRRLIYHLGELAVKSEFGYGVVVNLSPLIGNDLVALDAR